MTDRYVRSTLRAGSLAALLAGCDGQALEDSRSAAGGARAPAVAEPARAPVEGGAGVRSDELAAVARGPARSPGAIVGDGPGVKIDPGCPPWERPTPCQPGVLKKDLAPPAAAGPPVSRNIHGNDDRVDLYCVQSEPGMATAIGASVAIAWNANFVDGPRPGTKIIESPLDLGLCPDEAFAGQTQGVECSGVLVAPDVVLTLSKCFAESLRDKLDFVLDYRASAAAPDGRVVIEAQDICRPIPGAIKTFSDGGKLMLIGMRCGGPPRTPAPLAAGAPANGEMVYAIGYPGGLPAKFSGRAPVTAISDGQELRAPLDINWANSGSPAYNSRGEVFGVVTQSDDGPMTCHDEVNKCKRWKACSESDPACVGTTIRLATEAKVLIGELEAEMKKEPVR